MLKEYMICSIRLREEYIHRFSIVFCGEEWKNRCIEVDFLLSKFIKVLAIQYYGKDIILFCFSR